jgi:hypothetical protein
MPRNAYTISFNAPELSALDWKQLERVSPLTFTETQRAQLLAALNKYLESLYRRHFMADTRVVRAHITRIQTHAKALVKDLRLPVKEHRSSLELEHDSHVLEAVLGEIFPFDLVDPKTLARTLNQLDINATVWLGNQRKESQRGRAPADGLRQLICAWHAVYRAAGGTRRGCSWNVQASKCKGPFLALLVVALRQAASSPEHSLPPEWVRIPRNRLGDEIRKMPMEELTREPQLLSWEEVAGENRPET